MRHTDPQTIIYAFLNRLGRMYLFFGSDCFVFLYKVNSLPWVLLLLLIHINSFLVWSTAPPFWLDVYLKILWSENLRVASFGPSFFFLHLFLHDSSIIDNCWNLPVLRWLLRFWCPGTLHSEQPSFIFVIPDLRSLLLCYMLFKLRSWLLATSLIHVF